MKNAVAIALDALKKMQARWIIGPRYQPEKHYMRGPGPACAAKARARGAAETV
jgi:hypothetical protein